MYFSLKILPYFGLMGQLAEEKIPHASEICGILIPLMSSESSKMLPHGKHLQLFVNAVKIHKKVTKWPLTLLLTPRRAPLRF